MNTNEYLTGVQAGVQGWLLLFVFQRLIALFVLVPTLMQILAPLTLATDRGHTIFLLSFISSALSALIGLLATIGIFRGSPWALNAVAMNLLLVMTSYGIGFFQHGSFNSNYLTRAITGILVSIAWFAYFMVSERVRNTLGHNLLKAPIPVPDPISLP
jgi:hypothetical protein